MLKKLSSKLNPKILSHHTIKQLKKIMIINGIVMKLALLKIKLGFISSASSGAYFSNLKKIKHLKK